MRRYALCSKDKNRVAFAAEVMALAAKLGVEAVREIDPQYPREISVRIGIGTFRVRVEFDAGLVNALDAFCADWFTDALSDGPDYPADFAEVIGGTLNTTTFGKATTEADYFERLLASLECGIERLKPILAEAGIPIEVPPNAIAA